MCNDGLDRLGTPLEKRYSRSEIEAMMEDAGFERVKFFRRNALLVCHQNLKKG